MFRRVRQDFLALIAGLALLVSPSPLSDILPRTVSFSNAEAAYSALQQWYNQSNGLWMPSTGWWNSANCLTVIADLALIDEKIESKAIEVFTTTYAKAQQYNLQMTKVMVEENGLFMPQTSYTNVPLSSALSHQQSPTAQAASGFLNDYYDDEGWWALGWIAAYDVTGNQTYLSEAQAIFADMSESFGRTDCSTNPGGTGGIWWDKFHTYVNAIANELFLNVAAHLANRPRLSSQTDYLAIAKQQWAWFQGSGMTGSNSTINDGLDQQSCQNNGQTIWSYNQGVILGALTELSKATRSDSYLSEAQKIADAAVSSLAPDGILQDQCEPECNPDGTQFKGIFTRNLRLLHQASPQTRYAAFLTRNADRVWANDRDEENRLGLQWAGPFQPVANASTQSSALDAIVAALAIE